MSILLIRKSIALALLSLLAFVPLAKADIVVTTFLDANNNGVQDDGEGLITGLSVTGYDEFGIAFPFLDDGNGTFTLPTELINGDRIRVQVMGYNSTLRQGVAGPTSVFFASDGEYYDPISVPVTNGPAIEPGKATIMIPCYDGGPAGDKSSPGFVSFPYNAAGVSSKFGGQGPAPSEDVPVSKVGSTWGVAYQTTKNRVFTSTLLKRHVGLGPVREGGLYLIDYDNMVGDGTNSADDVPKPTVTSMDFQGLTGADGNVINFSTIRRESVEGDIDETMPYALTSRINTASYDMDAFVAVGKTSFGDIDLTEDENELWMVNLSDRTLISMDVSGDELGANIRSHKIMEMSGLPNLNFQYRMCINTGGNRNGSGAEAFTDRQGTAWDKNKYSEGGISAFNTGSFENTNNEAEKTSGDMLYQTYRMGTEFSYNISAPVDETYKVILHFAEPVSGYGVRARLFDIKAEGQTIRSNYDIVAAAGAPRTATTLEFEVPVSDGKINIEFLAKQGGRVNQAVVSGVEIIGQSVMESGVLRPWGLGFRDGKGWLGMVADGSISRSREHLMGYVCSFDPNDIAAGFKEEVAFELGYPRERASNAHLNTPQPLRSGEWQAWVDTWEETAINTDIETLSSTGALLTAYPQPILSDIDFTVDGKMVIGFMDRYAHQCGYRNYPPVLGNETLIVSYGAGDILKVDPLGQTSSDGFVLENPQDVVDRGPFRQDDGPSFMGEFFYDDYFEASSANHGEVFTGGLAILPTTGEVVNTVFNPVEVSNNSFFRFDGIYTQGIRVYSTNTGAQERAYLFVEQFTQGKSNGLGDIEMAFVIQGGEVGNYVWCDANGNGIQDPNENGIPGVVVELINKDNPNAPIEETTTDAMGGYLFTGLDANTCYMVRIDLSQLEDSGYTGETSPVMAGDDGEADSDGDPSMVAGYAAAMFCTEADGANMHDIDFGFIGPSAIPATKVICPDEGGLASILLADIDPCVDTLGGLMVMYYTDSIGANDMIEANKITDDAIVTAEDTCIYARVMIPGDMACGSIAKVTILVADVGDEVVLLDDLICPEDMSNLTDVLADAGYTLDTAHLDAKNGPVIDDPSNFDPMMTFPTTVYVDAFLTSDQNCPVCIELTINAREEPMVMIGNDNATVCFGDCVNLSDLEATFDSKGSGAVEAVWSTDGDGTFMSDTNTVDNTFAGARVYCPGPDDGLNEMVEIYLTIEDDMCMTSVPDTGKITIFGIGPEIIPGSTDTVLCIDSFALNPTSANDPFPGCLLVVNCAMDTISGTVVSYDIIEVNNCEEIVKLIKRTHRMYYDKQTYECCDTIAVSALPGPFICPPERDTVYCGNYEVDENGHPHPNETGVPMMDTVPLWPAPNKLCKILVDYKDTEFDGECPQLIKREWFVKDLCLGLDTTCLQWLMIYDTVPPVLKKDVSGFVVDTICTPFNPEKQEVILLPASTHSCDAHAYIPPVMVTDSCTDIKAVKVLIPGYATIVMEFNSESGLWESHEQVKLPKSDEPIPFYYEAFDKCHNGAFDTCYFYIKDYVKPVPVCDKGITVTVGDTTSWVYASSIDEGSWDNCGIAYKLVRRTDWATACGVNLCDDLEYICDTEHHDSLWCATLETDKHVNPIEAHYAKAIQWLCADKQECAAALLTGWAYDLMKYATLDCIDHPYPTDEHYFRDILDQCAIPVDSTSFERLDSEGAMARMICRKYGEEFSDDLDLCKPVVGTDLSYLDLGKQLGGGWSDAVPFCCEDACTNVTVELLLMDYWCNWSKCWQDVWVEDNTPPMVVTDLHDVNLTCASYKGYYAEAVDSALAGHFGPLQEALGKYDKISTDKHGHSTPKTSFRVYDVDCDSTKKTKETLVYDEHLGAQWITEEYYEAKYDTSYVNKFNGQISDNCGLVCIEDMPWVDLDHCGNGTIVRTFKFIGQCQIEGNEHKSDTIKRHQTIYIGSDCPITKAMFSTPHDTIIETCGLVYDPDGSGNVSGAASPDSLGYGEYLFDNDCRLVGVGYYDQVFEIVGGDEACYKILRTWCYGDWCEQGLDYPDLDYSWWHDPQYVGRYISCVQKILVKDVTPPVCMIQEVGEMGLVSAGGCFYNLDVEVSVEDECGLVSYEWQVKNIKSSESVVVASGGGELDGGTSTGFRVEAEDLAAGNYKIVVIVTDACNNEGMCEREFEVDVDKKPAPICITSLTAELTPMDTTGDGVVDFGMSEVWAREFNSSSEPACGGRIVDFRIDNGEGAPELPDAATGRSLILTCEDIPQRVVRMYVLDQNGQWDYCEVIIIVQDNMGSCGDMSGRVGTVTGTIATELNDAVEQVKVMIETQDGSLLNEAGDASGSFNLAVGRGLEAMIKMEKNTDYSNGVSTADLIAIQRHILGKRELDNWYREEAADANNDGRISPVDLVELRKLILAKTDELPGSDSWRFFSKETDSESYHIAAMPAEMVADFVGVKVGDVNLDNDPARKASRSGKSLVMVTDDRKLVGGEKTRVTLEATSYDDVAGYQYTLQVDPQAMQIDDVLIPQESELDRSNINLDRADEGWITVSWHQADGELLSRQGGERTIELVLSATKDVVLSNALAISSERTAAEAYLSNGLEMDVAIGFNNPIGDNVFALHQNTPNPFVRSTTIGFDLPEAISAVITIYDVAGKTVKTYQVDGSKGFNRITFDRPELTTGVLYYKLETESNTAVKKMILMN